MTETRINGVTERPLSALRPHKGNARTHSKKQIEQIAESIRRFGFTNPVLVDGEDRIIAGHGRLAAARLLDMEKVPVVAIEGMSEAERRAYIIADNRLAELAGWDEALLKEELSGILELVPDFDLEVTGFVEAELEALLAAASQHGMEDAPPVIDETRPPVSRTGDLWVLDHHRLLCGDARDPVAFARLMKDEKAQMVFTDPPYNVPVNGHICGLGKVKHAEFAMAAGEMSQAEFAAFLRDVIGVTGRTKARRPDPSTQKSSA